MATTVTYDNLSSWLQSQPENTADTPYEVNITNIPTVTKYDGSVTVQRIPNASKKYLDLSSTTFPNGITAVMQENFTFPKFIVKAPILPEGVTTMYRAFYNYENLIEIQNIPSTVTNLESAFNITKIETVPTIPNGVTNMKNTFGTSNLKITPNIPNGVTNLDQTFQGTKITEPPIIPQAVTSMQDTFYGCSLLEHPPIIPSGVTTLKYCFYETGIEEMPNIPNSVTNLDWAFAGCTLLTTTSVIPNSVTSMIGTFMACYSLEHSPIIPNTVTNMQSCFSGCPNLLTAPIIPNSVTNMDSCFSSINSYITHYRTVKNEKMLYKPIIPATVTSATNVFKDVITNDWGGSKLQIKTFSPSIDCELKEIIQDIPNNRYVISQTLVYAVDITHLNTFLLNQDNNTKFTPYSIKILSITSSNASDIKTTLIANNTKFVDLQYTIIPSGTDCTDLFADCVSLTESAVLDSNTTSLMRTFDGCSNLQEAPVLPSVLEDMEMCFRGCSSLETSPTIPSTVEYLDECFKNCSSLTEAPVLPNGVVLLNGTFAGCSSLEEPPVIPSGVTNIANLFSGCTSLEEAPDIPSGVTSIYKTFYGCTSIENISSIPASVTNGKEAFSGCTSLRKIDEFHIPLATLRDNSNFQDMFAGCTSLETIGFKVDTDKWHAWRLKFDGSSVEGKIFGIEQGQVVSTAIQNTQITQDDIKLPVLTDELWFPSGLQASEIEEVIEDMLSTKYGVFNKIVIPPNDKNMVIWANEDENHNPKVVTNLVSTKQETFDVVHPIGEIYIQYPQQKDPEDLYNHNGITSTWTLQTQYAGAFFRSSGGNADTFIEEGNALNIQGNQNAYHSHGMQHYHSMAHYHSKGTMRITGSVASTGYSIGSNTSAINGGALQGSEFNKKTSSGTSQSASYMSKITLDTNLGGWSGLTSNVLNSSGSAITNSLTGGSVNSSAGARTDTDYQGNSTDTEARPDNFTIQIWKRTA